MKKVVLVFISLLVILGICGCGKKEVKKTTPDLSQIRSICNLATLEVYYHNVAKFEKKADSGITHIFEKDREMWIEYTGVAKVGIDMSKVNMTMKDRKVKIFIPKAKLLSVDVGKIDKDSYIYSDDGINKNKITPEDETKAINAAQNKMRETVENDHQLLYTAQTRAQKLIEKYIIQIGELSGVEYEIEWELEEISK